MSDAAEGRLAAAGVLSRTILRPEVRRVIEDYQRLNSEEARAHYADHFLGRTAHVMDEIWPTFYELLKRVEDGELYRKPGYLGGNKVFDSFKDYWEYRVGQPFETWAQMESTYHYAQRYAPELFGETYGKARQVQEAEQRDKAEKDASQQGRRTDLLDNIQEVAPAPTGTGRTTALRRLRKEADKGNEEAASLRSKVLAGEMSPHAAMVEAGFRPKTISIPIGRPERVAAYLRKHMPREALARLVELLTKEDDINGEEGATTLEPDFGARKTRRST